MICIHCPNVSVVLSNSNILWFMQFQSIAVNVIDNCVFIFIFAVLLTLLVLFIAISVGRTIMHQHTKFYWDWSNLFEIGYSFNFWVGDQLPYWTFIKCWILLPDEDWWPNRIRVGDIAIFRFWKSRNLLTDGAQRVEIYHFAIFRQNWSIYHSNNAIFLFFKMAAICRLGFVAYIWSTHKEHVVVSIVLLCKIWLQMMQ